MASRSRLGPQTDTATRRPDVVAPAVVVGRGVLLVGADRGSRARHALTMQSLAGNAAVQRALVESSVEGHATCSTPELACSAKANRSYDSGTSPGSTKKSRDGEGNTVYTSTATGFATFKTTVDIHLATVPGGLSECATRKLQHLIDTKLSPHEQDHKTRFLTALPAHRYVGKWSEKVKATASDQATAEADAMAKAQTAIDDQATTRTEQNDKYAIEAIDPFSVTADISECDECKEDTETETDSE